MCRTGTKSCDEIGVSAMNGEHDSKFAGSGSNQQLKVKGVYVTGMCKNGLTGNQNIFPLHYPVDHTNLIAHQFGVRSMNRVFLSGEYSHSQSGVSLSYIHPITYEHSI